MLLAIARNEVTEPVKVEEGKHCAMVKIIIDGSHSQQILHNYLRPSESEAIAAVKHQRRMHCFTLLCAKDYPHSRVRFTSVLTVYKHFEDDDDDGNEDEDDGHTENPEIIGKIWEVDENSQPGNDRASFLRRRARRCWYSKEELKLFKDKHKLVVRMLKRVNVFVDDARSVIDVSKHELHGLESYLSVSRVLRYIPNL